MIKGLRACICLGLVGLVAGLACADENFLNAIESLANRDEVPVKVFDEQTPGFDLRDDRFYFQDNLVSELFKRKKFTHGLITLGGQSLDSVNNRAKDSSYPFAVAQRTTKGNGVLADRWDAKDLGDNKVEFFAIYHGDGKNDFVVNKVRAHLLRRLANAVQEYVPILDRSLQEDAAEHPKEAHLIHDELRKTIETVFAEIDQSIRLAMNDNDDSTAAATVAIVTESAVITASVGQGRVLAYDDSSIIQTLTNYHDDLTVRNVFGAKKSRQMVACKPHVEIFSRKTLDLQLLVIESPTVAENMDDYELFRIVLSEINQHKSNAANEQQIYSSSVSRILETSSAKTGALSRMFTPQDHTVFLIGLERDYTNIH